MEQKVPPKKMNTITHAANPYATYAPRLSLCAVTLIAAMHAGILVLLTKMDVVPMPTSVSTLMVDILRPELPVDRTPELPKPTPVEAKPRRQTAPVPQQMLAAQTNSPAAFSETTIVRDPPPPTLPDLPAPPAPATISQPRFAADYLSNPAPAYPPLSRRMGEEGQVVLRVHVETSGRPSQIEVRKSSGSPRLDQAALDAVWHWRFVPAKRGEEALAAWVLVPITFHLKN
ncbi:MAG: TonB family protein [Candidatus Accumulibacter phosphatis]|jgi:protein TonB|uniref:energy transducer TonB n=1 Tax=Candidatus Accumulibacter contiguus TaxID=2954381 RepID=UPI001A4E8DA6|nr:energy transducer TonB [Accumulibacter sp.]